MAEATLDVPATSGRYGSVGPSDEASATFEHQDSGTDLSPPVTYEAVSNPDTYSERPILTWRSKAWTVWSYVAGSNCFNSL